MYSSLAYYVSPVSVTHIRLGFLILKNIYAFLHFPHSYRQNSYSEYASYNSYLALWVELAQNGLQHKIIHGSLCTRQNKEM